VELRVRERRFSNGIYGWVPVGAGPCGAVLVVHDASPETAGWCNRDALMFAAHGLVGMPAYNDPVGAWPHCATLPSFRPTVWSRVGTSV
jgi:hypothetical protein